MADSEITKQNIIKSIFSRRAADGSLEETYVAHVLIHETATSDDGQSSDVKTRYLLVSVDRNGRGFLHKSKENSNHTFSIGKTWKLEELQAVEAHSPLSFSLRFARRYRWATVDARDQGRFLSYVIETFRRVTGGRTLQVIGLSTAPKPAVSAPNGNRSSVDEGTSARSSSPQPSASAPSPPRRPVALMDRNASTSSYGSSATQPNGATPVRPPYRPPPPSSLRAQSPVASQPQIPQPISIPGSLQPGQVLSSSLSSRTPDSTFAPRATPSPAPSQPRPSAEYGRPSADIPPSLQPSGGRASRPSLEQSTSSRSVPRNGMSPYEAAAPVRSPVLQAPPRSSLDRTRAQTPDKSFRFPPPQLAPSQLVPAPAVPPARAPSPSKAAPPRTRQDAPPLVRAETSNSRISVFDPANQATLDRLLATDVSFSADGPEDEEAAEVTIANVEEMLDGYEWTSPAGAGGRNGGAADQMEARLMDELLALEKANVHSFVESDDRIGLVMSFIDDAIRELDDMETIVQSYKIQLNAVSDDISYIQSQNRGLQVQTQNQKALLDELQNLLRTVDVDREALVVLTQESLEQPKGIVKLEEAAAQLYKALLAGRENEMAATMERLEEYRTHNGQFCKRISDFLKIMFQFQSDRLLSDKSRAVDKTKPQLFSHEQMEEYLGRYCGLMLYLKEMEEEKYSQVCAAYFTVANTLHMKEMKAFLPALVGLIRKGTDEEHEGSFASSAPSGISSSTTSRVVGTLGLSKSPLDRKKEKEIVGELKAAEAFSRALNDISKQIAREEEFLADFLQINDSALTFADYMKLETYYRRQAARYAAIGPATLKLIREGMDLIFGFLPGELKLWVEAAMRRDSLQLVGMIFAIERILEEASENGKPFFQRLVDKQHRRMYQMYDRLIDEQIKGIEQTKLTTKKRNGVAHFVKYFPIFVSRIENQLIGADGLEIRNKIDDSYEKLVSSMFDSLQQMAKLDGGDSQATEDKGQLNYHVIMIENMYTFITEMQQLEIAATRSFVSKAQTIYEDNLSSYLRLVIRRALNKLLIFFDALEKGIQSSPPTDVTSTSQFNKSSLRRVTKDFDAKDMRKTIDALYKRVEKHYSSEGANTAQDSASILAGVWKACEDELVRQTERFNKLIGQCYVDSGISLQFTTNDVQAACKRNRP